MWCVLHQRLRNGSVNWAREAGDDYYTRLAAAVNSYATPSPPDATIQLPVRGEKTTTLYAK